MDVPPKMHCKPSLVKSFTGHNAGETENLPNKNAASSYSGSVWFYFYSKIIVFKLYLDYVTMDFYYNNIPYMIMS